MFFVSEIYRTAPAHFKTDLQKKVYETLDKLNIPFERVDTDKAISMEDCIQINNVLDMKMVKTLFLCNRKQTEFYLFITTADKPFNAKEFAGALGIARGSFAPLELFEQKLGTKIGAATVYSALIDYDHELNIIFDADVANEEFYGCSDGTTTGYMKVKTAHILNDFLAFTKHSPVKII